MTIGRSPQSHALAAGQVGAALMTLFTGWALATWGSFTLLFFVAGSTYLVAWAIFHWVVPRLDPLDFGRSDSSA